MITEEDIARMVRKTTTIGSQIEIIEWLKRDSKKEGMNAKRKEIK
jgi:hypothetical protein